MCGLPGTLEGMALSLRLAFQKDMEGKKAMYATCRRRADGTWNEDPTTYVILYRYCGIDVETERAADKALPELPDAERKLFELDLKINRRGLGLDLPAARAFYVDKLAFEPGAEGPDGVYLRLPGGSGDEVKLEPAGDNTKPGLFFTVPDLQRAAADLKSRGLEVKTTPTTVSVTDPDGAIIVFTRSSAR